MSEPSPRSPAAVILEQARLFDTEVQAVIATDGEGRIHYWNDFAVRIYGWQRAEVLGRDIVEITPSDLTREKAARLMDRLRAGRSWSGRFEVRRRDGSRFLAIVRNIPLHDDEGRLVGILGVSTPAESVRREMERPLEPPPISR